MTRDIRSRLEAVAQLTALQVLPEGGGRRGEGVTFQSRVLRRCQWQAEVATRGYHRWLRTTSCVSVKCDASRQ